LVVRVCAVLRAVAADCFFNCWYLEIPSDIRIRHVRFRILCWKRRPRPSVAFRKSRLVRVLRRLLLVESFDLRPSNECNKQNVLRVFGLFNSTVNVPSNDRIVTERRSV
jgi:hypothetical protein